MKYPNKALEVVLDVISYPRGTTKYDDNGNIVEQPAITAPATNSQAAASTPLPASPGGTRARNTRTLQQEAAVEDSRREVAASIVLKILEKHRCTSQSCSNMA